jgi:F0F1-type ATP synthase epsilon subunit
LKARLIQQHSPLEKGRVVYKMNNNQEEVNIGGGVVEVLNNKVVLLAESILTDE